MKKNLLLILSSKDKKQALDFPLHYSSVALERKYFKKMEVVLWGPLIKELKKSKKLRKKIKEIQKTGVKFSACIVCVKKYKAKKQLKKLDIKIMHTGELLTKALKKDSWEVLST